MDDSLKGTMRALNWIEEEAKRLGIVVNTSPKKKKSHLSFMRKHKLNKVASK